MQLSLCKRVLLFQNEKRPRAHWLNYNPKHEIERFWIHRKRVGKSAFEWSATCFSTRFLPGFRDFIENFFLDRCPEPPDEDIAALANGNLQAPSNKEARFVDDALI